MGELSGYYNTLLGIEVTVLGVVAATIFVLVQLIYSRFSHREVKAVLATTYIYASAIAGLILLAITGVTSILAALGSYDFIPRYNLKTVDLIGSEYFVLILSVLFALLAVSFLVWAVSNLRYLHPTRLLMLFSRNVTNDRIRDFLYDKHGVPSPNFPNPIISVIEHNAAIREYEEEMKGKLLGQKVKSRPKSQQRLKWEADLRERQEQLEIDRVEHERVQNSVKDSEDPFEPIQQVAQQALSGADFIAYREYSREYARIAKSFLSSIQDTEDSRWNPQANLANDFVTNFVNGARAQLEIIDKHSLDSAHLLVLAISNLIADELLENHHYKALNTMATFWKRTAEKYLEKDKDVYKRVITLLRATVEKLLLTGDEKNVSLDEMFRILGWLGERLLITRPPEKKPLMPDHDYSSEFDETMEAILAIAHKFEFEHANWYPLIFFDLVDVILQKVIELSEKEYPRLHETIFNLVFIYSSFSERAILVGNGRGAELAAMRLNEAIERLKRKGLKERQQEAVELLLSLAAFAAGHSDKYSGAGLTPPAINIWAIDKIATHNVGDLSREVLEVYIKGEGDRDKIKELLKALSRRMGTNFGLNLE